MADLAALLKRLFCAHEWEASRFQALNAPDEVFYECRKCGKTKLVYKPLYTQGKDR